VLVVLLYIRVVLMIAVLMIRERYKVVHTVYWNAVIFPVRLFGWIFTTDVCSVTEEVAVGK